MVREFTGVDWIATIIKMVALILGTFIVYLAYKGYKRNSSKPLLYVSLGFALITAGTVVEGLLYVIFISDLLVAIIAGTAVTVIGLIVIIYSIYSVK
ncbi:MAG: hypothetical protein ACLPY5_15095 [Candidatus Bathyarchaeia archaeon]